MKLPLSVPMESSATRQLNVCLTSSALFFIMNSSDSLPFDRLTLSVPTRKLVFVSESVPGGGKSRCKGFEQEMP